MSVGTFQGVVRGGSVFLANDLPFPDGTKVLVTPLFDSKSNAAALIAAMDASPRVPKEWVDELDELIEQGCRPPGPPELFEEPIESANEEM